MIDVVNFIKKYNNFIIIGHKEPDFDCIGSSLALASFLSRINKKAIMLNEGPFVRKEIIPFENKFLSRWPDVDFSDYAVIILDCSIYDRVGDEFVFYIKKMPIVVIDHHASGDKLDAPGCVDPCAPSTTFLIEKLVREFGHEVTREEAWYILVGFCTDTGFFRFISRSDPEPFEMVARLVSKGLSLKDVYSYVESVKSLTSIEILSIMLNNLRAYFDGRVLLTVLPFNSKQDTNVSGVNELFYALLANVENNEILVILKEIGDGSILVGLRSREYFDVGELAKCFGGGGHKHASGFRVKNSTLTLLECQIIAYIKDFIKN
ncbi:bifunctional oligoribonuclease/PAP phosphatase NrnA [Borrelia miyamotoi]|uniref:Bifunctional oligoribonuclease/PAP phosphatase NrnA n=1 Tax=Borrelia miyamotoi TaxID=47466 RepID=A0AAX3JLY0_9SPIR|nr:bifunctional oligoribonuclease/PAP phosphatase NrnA [Borrelia miyamotoi]QFP41749.1 bifunctional oligoribonuclease/PAP phosphatase NrnA [Borrelia miyamotoi]QFP47869.1 bifunctional oligoribonuclease/PAP phosphatase NrnA [Borrelia miyamotoi]QGT55629.1 bifunctional oligoribonuclease/PAP phosphatase NrnA [Borrelia miyamotoi]QGT56413.1 bifunctional oligoribonuclease/PAP phosphatase NrnA [Borrelia miyamotoi]WAZ71659.1 bifunctional oligoribonuclease/PAP phosphatase NrnA [Borrelia miyamotoi]